VRSEPPKLAQAPRRRGGRFIESEGYATLEGQNALCCKVDSRESAEVKHAGVSDSAFPFLPERQPWSA